MGVQKRMTWVNLGLNSLMGLGLLLVTSLVLAWQLPLGGQIRMDVGDVARFDIVAPRAITYDSAVLTQIARERAVTAVPDYYDPPQGHVRRQQVNRSRDVLDFIDVVRMDSYGTVESKSGEIAAIPDVKLVPELTQNLLRMAEEDWLVVQREVPQALDRAMREEIYESRLNDVRRRVAVMFNPDINENVGVVAGGIVRELIRPNSFLNVEATEANRQAAFNNIPIQTTTLEAGEIILRAGDIATAGDVEALEQLGLQQVEWNGWRAAQAALFSLVLMAATTGALFRLRPTLFHGTRQVALLVILVGIWVVGAKLMMISHNWLPYLYPIAALGMLVTVLIDLQISVVITAGCLLLLSFLDSSSPALLIYAGLGSLTGAIVLGRAERLTAFLWAGLAVILSNGLTAGIFLLPTGEVSSASIWQVLVAAMVNGGISASVALAGYFVMGNLFGITTSLQLMELSRPTHPLLNQLLLKAPGTYHHTILVSNLAERAAEAIGADAFLTRVGAYYHDIGKTVRPYFFAENIDDGRSPYEKLDPVTSAQIIISHVTEGVSLGQRHRLPQGILDFIREHHGAQVVKYFYIQARNHAVEGETIAEADFCYPGPDPRSKETAILMLADSCEAAVRANRPDTREGLESLVGSLINERVMDGSLDQSNLTFQELKMVKQVFLQVLQGVHHPRLKYPELAKASPPATTTEVQEPKAVDPRPDSGPDQDELHAPAQPARRQRPRQVEDPQTGSVYTLTE